MNKKQLDDRTLKIFWYKSKPEIEKSLTLLCPSTLEKALAHALVVEENHNTIGSEPAKKKVKFDTDTRIIRYRYKINQIQESVEKKLI